MKFVLLEPHLFDFRPAENRNIIYSNLKLIIIYKPTKWTVKKLHTAITTHSNLFTT